MQYTLEDFLVKLHMGQWFGWSDPKNKTYANLVIHSDDTKPTEQECLDGVTALQLAYDSNLFQRQRATDYPSLQDQADMQYWDSVNGTTTWLDAINEIKTRYPKP